MSGTPLLLQIALRFGALALVAVGGANALIPALHEQAVGTMHWLTDAQFAESVGLAQAAPGPNVLLIPLIGWGAAGLAGAFVALAAFLAPSAALAILGARFLVRHEGGAPVRAFKWALRPVTGGLMLSSAIVLIGTAARTWPLPASAKPAGAVAAALTFVALAVAAASLRFRLNPLVWLGAAALAGALLET